MHLVKQSNQIKLEHQTNNFESNITAVSSTECLETCLERTTIVHVNPFLGTTWPFVYFMQGRLGRAAIVTRAYWFVCPAVVAKHLWCEQPVKEVQLTSISYVQICVYSSSYGEFLW